MGMTSTESFLTVKKLPSDWSTASFKRIRKVPCPICHKQFFDRSSMNRHYRIHTGEKKFQCDVCFKRFNRSDTLKFHRNTHLTEKLS